MNIRHIFMTIAAVLLTSAVLADSSSVTSKKYVDDFMAGYQNKIPGSGADKLMIYDDTDGIGAKDIVSSLGVSTSATDVPNVGAVKAGIDGKQDTINGTAGYVMTGTGTAGNVGEKPIYGTSENYVYSLVTAETVNSGVINAVNSSLIRVDADGNPSNTGTLWEINTDLFALSTQPLPAGYTRLEYVNMDSGSYLLTNLVPTYDGKIEMVFKTTSVVSGIASYLGGRNAAHPAGLLLGTNSNNRFVVTAFSSNGYTSPTNKANNTRYKFTFNNKVATLESGGATLFTNTFTGTDANGATLVINGLNSGGTVTANPEGIYLYSFKMWNAQDGLIADYIPVTYNNAVGFYDIVSGTFKTATSGTFTAGPSCASPNLFDGVFNYTANGTGGGQTLVSQTWFTAPDTNENTNSYTLSMDVTASNVTYSEPGNLLYLVWEYSDGTKEYKGVDTTNYTGNRITLKSNSNKKLTSVKTLNTHARFTGGTITVSNLQIEKGATATPYRPYGNTCD